MTQQGFSAGRVLMCQTTLVFSILDFLEFRREDENMGKNTEQQDRSSQPLLLPT